MEREHLHRRAAYASSAESRRRIAEIAGREARREIALRDRGATWASLGPTTGETVDKTGVISDAESGLVEAIRIDPRDPNSVFIATAGGGIWKTANIAADPPVWRPFTDRLGNLAIGGFDLDPRDPQTIVIGVGEPYYQRGGFVQRTNDGGVSWSDPVPLGGATNVRDLRIDPSDANVVLVATDVGLFRSTDAGAQFAAIDLPNPTAVLEEAAWSLAYTGADATGSHWVVSAVAACDAGLAPPQESGGLPPMASCKRGNPGDIWRSVDGGATWTLAKIPTSVNANGVVTRAGRMTLAAGNPADPARTVVYAMVSNRDERASETIDILRSTDGGATFVSAKGALTNPDTICTNLDIGASQSGFNQAIAVDPANDARVIVAGLYCSVRSVDATNASPTWQVVSDVFGTQTSTACGAIPYVHSDFHAVLIAGGRVLLGGDGGIESSDDALTVATGDECSTTWNNANRGLVTHLAYSIASGDPAAGDAEVVYAGLQDLSSRWRDGEAWNTINLSDGTGGAIARTGGETVYWAAQAGDDVQTPDRTFCKRDCGQLESWHGSNPTLPAGDSEPFVTYLATDATGAVLSHSTFHMWRADATPAWTDITGKVCDHGTCTASFAPYWIANIAASPRAVGLYAAALYDHAAVTSNGGAVWTVSAPLGVGGAQVGWAASVVALPPYGNGNVYLAGTAAELLADGSPVPDSVGHLFVTKDRGRTWSSLAGSGLPNVPVWAIAYDPRDAKGATIFVATEIGVYQTVDAGASWSRVGSGLPMVRTTGLALASDGSFLRVSTWGRGVWELALDGGKADGEDAAPAGCGCRTAGSPALVEAVIVVGLLRRRRRGVTASST